MAGLHRSSTPSSILLNKITAEELRIAKETREKANLAESQFLAMTGYEIGIPMNGVIDMNNLLLGSPLSREQHEYAETICTSGYALLTTINNIFDLSETESGCLQRENAGLIFQECTRGALNLLAVRAFEKQIDLLYETEKSTLHMVRR